MIQESPLWCYSEILKVESERYLDAHIDRNIAHNRQEMELSQMSIARWMEKENGRYAVTGMLGSLWREKSLLPCYSASSHRGHYAQHSPAVTRQTNTGYDIVLFVRSQCWEWCPGTVAPRYGFPQSATVNGKVHSMTLVEDGTAAFTQKHCCRYRVIGLYTTGDRTQLWIHQHHVRYCSQGAEWRTWINQNFLRKNIKDKDGSG